MSFALALATPPFAMIGADTRTNIVELDGSMRVNDDRPLSVSFADGTRVSVGVSDRKMRRFHGGWVAGVGNFFLVDYAINQLKKTNARTPEKINTVLREAYHEHYPKIQKQFPDDESVDITGFLYLYSTANRFRAASLGFGENMITDNTNDVYYGFPPEVPDEAKIRVQTMMKNIVIPVDMPGVWNAVRLAASAFHEVSTFAKSVSDILDLAVMVRGDQGVQQGRLLADNPTIIAASDEGLAAMLQPV